MLVQLLIAIFLLIMVLYLKNDPPEVKVGRAYEERKEAERARNAAQSAAGRFASA